MLAVSGLQCLRGGRQLFGSLDFSVSAGELLHVQGANGSGKTSLLRILTGLSRPDGGVVCWNGTDIRQAREEYAAQLLYLGHQPAVKDDLTVLENLRVSSRIAGLDPTDGNLRTALEMTGLATRSALPVRVLSQGQRRRLTLSRLWLDTRPLWVLDEPFTALDVQAGALLEARLESHLAVGGMVVLTTHQRPAVNAAHLHVLSLAA